jgi:hypothetical protein
LEKLLKVDYTPPKAGEAASIEVGFTSWLVRRPGQLHRNGDNDGKEKARKLGMLGPEHLGDIKFPGPETGRGSDQARYQGDFQSPHECPFNYLYEGSPDPVPGNLVGASVSQAYLS